jgi:hypothetical protein
MTEDEVKGPTKPRQFRLGEETLADLDMIAAFYSKETGIEHTRTDAVRVSAKKEADRIRRRESGK